MKYQVIYADPPWHYNSRKTVGERKNKTKFGGGAEKHYQLMKDSELLGMANYINSISDKNCALFMWATFPRLDFGIELLKSWGFRFATVAFVWTKTTKSGKAATGPGYYTASNAEIVLLGVRGSMRPIVPMINQEVRHPRMKHSQKPIEVSDRIIRMYPTAHKIELFARQQRSGFDCRGNQLDGWDATNTRT